MILEQHPDLQQLSPADKLSLVTELWDDLASQPNGIPITSEQIAELDRRMAAYRKDEPPGVIVSGVMDTRQDPRVIIRRLK